MRTYSEPNKVVHYSGLVLGQLSLVVGFLLALGYAVGSALIVAQRGRSFGLLLSPGPPLFGLACGALAIALVRWGRSRTVGAALAGLVLNALALALAAWLLARP